MKEAAEGSKTLSITDTGVSKGTGTGDCSDSPAQLRRGGGREGVLRIQKGTSRPSVDKNRACVERRKRVLISETTTRRLKLLWHMNGSKASASFPKKWKKKRLKWGHSHQPGRRVKTDFFFLKKDKKKKSLTVNCLAARSTPALPRTRTTTLQKSLPSPLRMRRGKREEKKNKNNRKKISNFHKFKKENIQRKV